MFSKGKSRRKIKIPVFGVKRNLFGSPNKSRKFEKFTKSSKFLNERGQEGLFTNKSILFHARNQSFTTPNEIRSNYQLTQKLPSKFTLKGGDFHPPSGVEGRGILAQSSAELDPAHTTTTPNLDLFREVGATNPGSQSISSPYKSVELKSEKERFPNLDEFLKMQYVYSQTRQRGKNQNLSKFC